MTDENEFKPITDRLDALIRLFASSLPKEITQAKKIEILSSVGLAPKEIADILGTTPNTVSVTLSGLKKRSSITTKEPIAQASDAQQALGEKPSGDDSSA